MRMKIVFIMIKIRKLMIWIFITILFCSNRCAREATTFHIYNSSKLNIMMLSKSEIIDYKNGFVAFEAKERTIKKSDDTYLSLDEFDLKNFKNNNENYLFFIVNFENKFSVIDSIKINKKK